MDLIEKMNIIVETVEENCHLPCKENNQYVCKLLEKKLFMSADDITTSFSFITDMTMADYIQHRKLHNIILELERNAEKEKDRDKIATAADKFGYSERSSFERAFKGVYGVTPSAVLKGNAVAKFIMPFDLEKHIENIKANSEVKKEENKVQYDDGMSLTFDLNDLDNFSMFVKAQYCSRMYGMSYGEVMIVYSMLNEKNEENLESGCQTYSNYFLKSPWATFSEFDKDCLYLSVNYDISRDEAEDVLALGTLDIKSGLNEFDELYLWFVKTYNGEKEIFTKNFRHDIYIKKAKGITSFVKSHIEESGNYCREVFIRLICALADSFNYDQLKEWNCDIVNFMELAMYEYKRQIDMEDDEWEIALSYWWMQEGLSKYDIKHIINEMSANGKKVFSEYDMGYVKFIAKTLNGEEWGSLTYKEYLKDKDKYDNYERKGVPWEVVRRMKVSTHRSEK